MEVNSIILVLGIKLYTFYVRATDQLFLFENSSIQQWLLGNYLRCTASTAPFTEQRFNEFHPS